MAAILFNEYTFLLWWIALMAVAAWFVPVTTTINVLGQKEKRVNLLFAVVVFFPVFRLAAYGPMIGDVWGYVNSYKEITATLRDVGRLMKEHESGYGFEIFETLLHSLFGNNTTAYRVSLALIQSIPIVLIMRRYSENYLLSVFLFVAGTYHIAWMMNGLRQFVAVVIIFSAFPLLLKKRYIPMILIILLATTIHTSAIVMLPVIFIVQGKMWNWRTIVSILAAVAAAFAFNRRIELFDVLVENTEYENAVSYWVAMGDDGANPIRVLVSAIPMILGLVGRNHLPQENPVVNVCVNMSVITTGINLVAMVTSGVMVGRLPVYTSLYSLILYPVLIRHVFTESSQRIITVLLIGFYLAWYFYSMR